MSSTNDRKSTLARHSFITASQRTRHHSYEDAADCTYCITVTDQEMETLLLLLQQIKNNAHAREGLRYVVSECFFIFPEQSDYAQFQKIVAKFFSVRSGLPHTVGEVQS